MPKKTVELEDNKAKESKSSGASKKSTNSTTKAKPSTTKNVAKKASTAKKSTQVAKANKTNTKEAKASSTTKTKAKTSDQKSKAKTTKKPTNTTASKTKPASKKGVETKSKANTSAKSQAKPSKKTAPKVESKKNQASKTAKVAKVETKEPKKEVTKETKSANPAIEKSKAVVKAGQDIKPKESIIISKIKSFLKKIVDMQEEARREREESKSLKIKDGKSSKEVEQEKKVTYNIEYYDLPYRYNETVVKILAQTPKRLFVYWDISDGDRERYINAFGDNFFNDTYPVLLVHNDDKNYTFEVPINDFANSWYLDIVDSKSKYTIQLGRKFKEQSKVVLINTERMREHNIAIQNDYLPITTSNTLEAPNDHILFENMNTYIKYRNVKTMEDYLVYLDNLDFASKVGKIYNIYDMYKRIYKKEMDEGTLTDLLNPSSKGKVKIGINMPSSHTSSQFK